MIRFEHLSKKFDDKVLFRNFSLELPEKGIVCFFAPSGFGKTTLFRMLLGLEEPDSGVITGTEGLRFSAAFQEPRLVPWLTALENVLLPGSGKLKEQAIPSPEQKRAEELLLALGLGDESGRFPDELSGGEKQRVSLARALFSASDVLILDEPFTGIDEGRKQTIFPLLKREGEARLILMTSHQESDAEALGAARINFEK